MNLFSIFSLYFSRTHLTQNIWAMTKKFFAILGVVELILNVASYFIQNSNGLRLPWTGLIILLIALFALAFFSTKPQYKVSYMLDRTDVKITVQLGDVFSGQGDLVVACNRTFDTSIESQALPANSVQAQYQRKMFSGDVSTLNRALVVELAAFAGESNDNGFDNGKKEKYDVGTMARITHRDGNAYFVAFSETDKRGKRSVSLKNFRKGLVVMWNRFAEIGFPPMLKMPVLCSGTAGLALSREEIIKEIVFSFVNFARAKKIRQNLSIYVNPNDIDCSDFDMRRLAKFLELACAGDLMSVSDPGRDQDGSVAIVAGVGMIKEEG